MNILFYCWPLKWPKGVGFHKPTVRRPSRPHCTTRQRALSPRLVQGGRFEILMQGIWPNRSHSPHNLISTVVGLATPIGSAHPTTPTSTPVGRSRPLGPTGVPSGLCPSVDAGVSHVPVAPTRPLARWRWSAVADDRGRSEFPLVPPSFAALMWAAAPPFILKGALVTQTRQVQIAQHSEHQGGPLCPR